SAHLDVLYEIAITVGSAIPEKLPRLADFINEGQIEIGDYQFVLVLRTHRHETAARIAEVRGAVEFPDVPGRFRADAVRGADEIAVGDRVRGLLQLPQILRQSRHRRRRIEDDL